MSDEGDKAMQDLVDALDRGDARGVHWFSLGDGGIALGLREDLEARMDIPDGNFPVPPARECEWEHVRDTSVYQWKIRRVGERVFRCSIFPTDKKVRGNTYASQSGLKDSATRQFTVLATMLCETISGAYEKREYGEATLMFDADTVALVRDSLRDIRDALDGGTVIWSAKAAKRRKALAAAQGDSAFRAFMAATLVAPKKAQRKRGKP
jgi:hypothetical protein